MRRILFLFFILCSFGSLSEPLASAQSKESYSYCLDQAQAALSRNEYIKAIDYLKRAHLASPSSKYPLEKVKAIQDLIRNRSRYDDVQRRLRLYNKYTQMGKGAFERGDYQKASYYFHYAGLMVPDGKKSGQYINLIKRTVERRVVDVPDVKNENQFSSSVKVFDNPKIIDQDSLRNQTSKDENLKIISASVKSKKFLPSQKMPLITDKISSKTLPLDDALWASQPKTQLQIEHGSYLILESRDIDRFLVITPGIIDIERLDRDHLKITPIHIGATFVHIWDSRGRWTFGVQIIFPVQAFENKPQVPTDERYVDPFKFTYALDGGSLYRGNSIRSSKRENLNMQQVLAVKGETPHGVADGSVGYYKFEQSTEATNYTVGLSGAKGAGFTGVNVRGYDAVKYFSALTFPGQYFRGFLIEGKTLGENIAATYVYGQDRFTYSYISPGVVEDRRSYIEGARVTLFPNDDNQYSVNYARGYGPARQTYLKNEVYSLEAQHRFEPMLLKGEVATNKDTLAETISSRIQSDGRLLHVDFRDIDKEFTTITGLPSNRGEIGANVGMDMDYDLWSINSNVDFYRDRFLPNLDDPDSINYDLNSSVNFILNDTMGFASTVYYLDTPGELSPRKNFRWMNTLSKQFKVIGNRDLRTFVGGSYNRNRVKDTPISEYDRYAASAGFQVGIINHLSYFANYEYSWVDELLSGRLSYPSVFNTGLNYARELTEKISTNIGFYYRDEQNSDGTNSFLAGEDSITGNLGLSYRPTNSSELFVDSRVRNVWRENPDNPAYNEIDVRWGLRSSWDLPFSWNPSGVIYGVVYKDLNSDGQKDPGEPGIADVHIKVGKQEVLTNSYGRYKAKVRAKEVMVSADSSTVATGYVLSTPAIFEISIPHKQSVNFGFTAQSGIYGIVYYDRNQDNQPNQGDEFIQKARIILDDTVNEISDYDGTYFFKNVGSGKHTLRIDVNSLPIEYLPLIRLVNRLKVEEGSVYVFHVPLKKKSVAVE